MKTEGMSYDEALEWVKAGVMVSRKAWFGHCFLFRQVNNVVPLDRVGGMASLPLNVKTEFIKHGKDLSYSNQIMQVATSGDKIAIEPFQPEWRDEYYKDWYIL
jgi:hypothetical protein